MMRLVPDAIYYLRLSRSRNCKIRQLDCFHSFEEAVKGWTIGSRVSPIFGLTSSPPPEFFKLKRSWLIFCGPIYPGKLEPFNFTHVFLSYGLFDIVFFCTSIDEVKKARKFVKDNNLSWEEWLLSKNIIEKGECGGPDVSDPIIPQNILRPLKNCPQELKSNSHEYVAQIASAVARAKVYLPDAAEELIRFDSICRSVLENTFDSNIKQDILVNTNAALQLNVSQTYSGTPPIFETKSRLWNHSLLGIGIASMALSNVRLFIEQAIGDANIINRIKSLQKEQPMRSSLVELPPEDKFWKKDHLSCDETDIEPEPNKPTNNATEDPVLPLLTFFSGRDGYRTTHFTLSAPLELINSCNTLSWTLLTITHEMSHTIIAGVLGEFLAKPSDDADRFLPAIRSLTLKKGGNNLYEQIRSLLCMGVWRMSSTGGRSEALTASRLRDYVCRNWHELNEILTSCFDFLYFYRSDPNRYIRSLWITWEVIPNIGDRIPEYITRCLCALHTNNVLRDNGRSISLNDFMSLLSNTKREFPNLKYATIAENEVNQDKQKYLTILKERELLVKFVRHFLHSSEVAKIVMPVCRISRNAINPMNFPREPLQSPLRYIEEVANDKNSRMLKSFGIFQRLAFMDLK